MFITVNFHMQLLQYRLNNKIRHFWRLNYAWYSNNHMFFSEVIVMDIEPDNPHPAICNASSQR